MAPARRGLRLGGYGVSVIDMAAPRPVAVTVSVSTPRQFDRPPAEAEVSTWAQSEPNHLRHRDGAPRTVST